MKLATPTDVRFAVAMQRPVEANVAMVPDLPGKRMSEARRAKRWR